MPTRTTGCLAFAGVLVAWGMTGPAPLRPDLKAFRVSALHESAAFPPAPAHYARPHLHAGAIVATPLDRQVAALGHRVPRYADPARRRFAEAPDLMRFGLELAARAKAGDGASAYVLYLALEQCRNFLRLNAESARVMLERVNAVDDLNPEERAAWQADAERCGSFAGGDWSAIGEALGDDKPGAETEYASVWFERAATEGFPAAVAEQALRPGPLTAGERVQHLQQALQARDPDVYWLLFAHSGDVPTGDVSAQALAWLLLACRAGADCTEQARWYRGYACVRVDGDCEPGQSAIEYYWYAVPDRVREQAWQLADRIDADVRVQSWDRLPLPDLATLDTRDERASLDAPPPD